jgi:hypothetical protein
MVMTASGFRPLAHRHWKDLFLAAMFETDWEVLVSRLAEAEGAIIARGRELLHATGDITAEREAVEDALYVLRAYRNAYRQSNVA